MWTVTINNVENGVADVNATDDSGFSFGSRIKVGEIDSFVDRAKAELVKYQESHKDDLTLKQEIETLLNS